MILIIAPEPWDGHSVSKHHYARTLAERGHDVLFHGPPEEGPLRLEKVGQPNGSLTLVRGPRVAPGLRFYPAFFRNLLEARWLKRVESLAGQEIHVVWLFENSRFFDMRFAAHRLKIYHQVDLNQDFFPEVAAMTADYVFCTSNPIRDRLSLVRSDIRIIHHGVQSAPIIPLNEVAFFSSEWINCVYAGNLSMKYLDRDLILRCIRAFPDVLFHFFGAFLKDDPFEVRLAEHSNVILHGKVDARCLLSILAQADILMVAYQKAHFLDQSNPHKMMEYMMSGKITVATYTSEYEPVSDLLAMCAPDDDYVELLGSVIRYVDSWNTPDLIAARRRFAADNTYSRQLDRIAEALGPNSHLIS